MEARQLSDLPTPPFQLALRVRHPTMDPAEISRELHLEADYCFRAGEPRKSRSGMAPTAVHAESYWLGNLDSVPGIPAASMPERYSTAGGLGSLEAAETNTLGLALSLCTRHFLRTRIDFIRRVQTEGGQVNLLVTVSPKSLRGFTISPETGHALSELGIGAEFEFAES